MPAASFGRPSGALCDLCTSGFATRSCPKCRIHTAQNVCRLNSDKLIFEDRSGFQDATKDGQASPCNQIELRQHDECTTILSRTPTINQITVKWLTRAVNGELIALVRSDRSSCHLRQRNTPAAWHWRLPSFHCEDYAGNIRSAYKASTRRPSS